MGRLYTLVVNKLSGKTSYDLFQISYFCLVSDYNGLARNSCKISSCKVKLQKTYMKEWQAAFLGFSFGRQCGSFADSKCARPKVPATYSVSNNLN